MSDGTCWRGHADDPGVTQRELDQWFFKITAYAEELLEWCDKLPGWPERVLTMQRNWIGKSIGAEIHFPLENSKEVIKVFTTRQDTVFGATFMSLAPEHSLALRLSKGTPQEQAVREFVERMRRQDKIKRTEETTEKEGVFAGAYCLNPVTKARMPIFVANFVLMEYGTGAVMAVPTHDQRDFEFAKKFGLPLIVVVQPEGQTLDRDTMTEAYEGEGVLVNSGQFYGEDSVNPLQITGWQGNTNDRQNRPACQNAGQVSGCSSTSDDDLDATLTGTQPVFAHLLRIAMG
jgi:leucyl-tRNA synthetase